ncbi:hypothetical protein COP2_003612 [Malus domestica]
MPRLGSDTALQFTFVLCCLDTVYNIPETVDNLPESANSLHDSREPQVYTGMVLPDSGLRPLGSGRLYRGLIADGYQVLEVAVEGRQLVD